MGSDKPLEWLLSVITLLTARSQINPFPGIAQGP